MSWTRHLVIATTVALTGGLMGSGLAWLLAAQLVPRPMELGPPPRSSAAPGEPDVLAGSLFPATEPTPPRPPPDDDTRPSCGGDWTLVGVVRDRRPPSTSGR